MPRPLLALVAILKNEAASIGALLDSALPFVDQVVVLDTGSKDDTWSILTNKLATPEGTHLLVQEPVVPFHPVSQHIIDFAATRNRCLELAESRDSKAVFTLYMSGDEVLEGGAELRAFLEAHRDDPTGAWGVTMRHGVSTWPYNRILRVDAGWRYHFPIHEMPLGPNLEQGGGVIPGASIVYAPPAGDTRVMTRHKEVDLPVLEYLAEQKPETHLEHLSRSRALLFLAQTHEFLATECDKDEPGGKWLSHQYAALGYYQRRTHVEGDANDANYALFHYFEVAARLGVYTKEELMSRLIALTEIDGDRPELYYKIALYASQIDARLAAHHAVEAVKVARAAKTKVLPFSTDSRIEWLCLQIAAEASSLLKMNTQAKRFAEQGIAAGGPTAAFSDWL